MKMHECSIKTMKEQWKAYERYWKATRESRGSHERAMIRYEWLREMKDCASTMKDLWTTQIYEKHRKVTRELWEIDKSAIKFFEKL